MTEAAAASPIFYVLYIPDEEVAGTIDAIRFLANPLIKHRAHLTVRGPCQRPAPVDKLNQELAGNVITISGIDRFAGERQKTVFLACEGTHLRRAWWKRDYGYCPHITLYDGSDADFAAGLASVARRHAYQVSFVSDRLEELQSRSGLPASRLAGYFDACLSALIRSVTGVAIHAADVPGVAPPRRLELAGEMLGHLAGLSTPIPYGQAVALQTSNLTHA